MIYCNHGTPPWAILSGKLRPFQGSLHTHFGFYESWKVLIWYLCWKPGVRNKDRLWELRGYSGLLTETCALPHVLLVAHTHSYIIDFGSFKSVNERKDSK